MQRDTPIEHDMVRSVPADGLEPIFDPDGTTTAAGFAPAADGVAVLVLSTETTDPLGSLLTVRIGAGDLVDPLAGIGVASGIRADSWQVAEPSASTALLAIDELGLDETTVNDRGGTIAVGDAGAAEDLRLIADALHRAAPGDEGAAVRNGGGAAAVSHWRRS